MNTLTDATQVTIARADGVVFHLDRIVPRVQVPGLDVVIDYRANPRWDASPLPRS